MRSPNITDWNSQKSNELYSLSRELLGISDEVLEFQIRELQSVFRFSIGLSENLIEVNLFKARATQLDRTIESFSNLARMQKRVKNKFDYIKNQVQLNAVEYKSNSVALITEFIEEGDRKHSLSAKGVADAIRVASDLGEKAYRTAEIAADVVAENTNTYFDKYIDE